MQCSNCKSNIWDNSNYCPKCGNKVEKTLEKSITNEDKKIVLDKLPNEKKEMKEKSLIWLYYSIYFRLLLGLLSGVAKKARFEYELGYTSSLSDTLFIIQVILIFVTIIQVTRRKKSGYYLMIFMIVTDAVSASILSDPSSILRNAAQSLGSLVVGHSPMFLTNIVNMDTVIGSTIILLIIWTWPNYIYLKKRKNIFGFEEDNNLI